MKCIHWNLIWIGKTSLPWEIFANCMRSDVLKWVARGWYNINIYDFLRLNTHIVINNWNNLTSLSISETFLSMNTVCEFLRISRKNHLATFNLREFPWSWPFILRRKIWVGMTNSIPCSNCNGVSPGVPVVYLLFEMIKQWQVLYIHISESPKEKVMSDEIVLIRFTRTL